MSQQQIIVRYLRDMRAFGEGWVKAGTIRSKETRYGFIGFRGDRDCRDLVKAEILEKRMNGGFCEVRYKEQEKKELSVEEKMKMYIQ